MTGRIDGFLLSRIESDAGMSEITPEVVTHLAGLARIALTDDEVDHLAGQLDTIVDAVAKVSEVATPDVEATSHPIPLSNVARADEPGITLKQADALAGGPETAEGRFVVSAILGEEQ